MDTCKYVVIDTPEGGLAAFIFPPFITHDQFVRNWCPYEGASKRTDSKGFQDLVLSAGFVGRRDDGSLYAYGESHSLKLHANPTQDDRLLNRLIGNDT